MNEKDLKRVRVLSPRQGSTSALTLDEAWIVSTQGMASQARGPLRWASLEDLVALRDEETRLNRRRRLIIGVIVVGLFIFA